MYYRAFGLLATALLFAVACASPTSSGPAARQPSASVPAGADTAPAGGAASAVAADPTPWPASASRTSMKIGLNAFSASLLPLWVAKDEGIFDKYGFDVEFVTLQSSSQVAKVMASGEIPIAVSAAAGVVDAALAGDDQILLSGFQNYMNFWVYARPEVTSVGDLRGKKVGTTRIGSGAHLGVLEMLRANNLQPDRDVAVLQIGGTAEVYGALSAGAVDAAILSIPYNFQAQDHGMRLIWDVSAQKFPYLQNGVATTRDYLQHNPDLVRRFMMAHVEGIARVYQDKPAAVEVLLKYLRSDDRELMNRTYDLITPFFKKVPYPAPASIQTVIDQRSIENPDASKLTPAAVSDDSILKDLEAAGFTTRLYGTSSPSVGRQ
jgi:NitT/TauT family transport system substrate-binding protein